MKDSMWKRFAGTMAVLGCVAALCYGAAGWRNVDFTTGRGSREAADVPYHSGDGSEAPETGEDMRNVPEWLRSMEKKTVEPGENIVMLCMPEGGKEYAVTMETWGGDGYGVRLWDGDRILQQTTGLLAEDGVAAVWTDDLNFDGFPDLVVNGTESKSGTDCCRVYVWDAEAGQFGTSIDIPFPYKKYEEEGVVVAQRNRGSSILEIMYGTGGDGNLLKLREWQRDYWDRKQCIRENGQDILFEGSMESVREDCGEEIFWSGLRDGGQEKETYWTVDAGEFKVSLRDLVPGCSLQLVLHGEDGEEILRVYRKDYDYASPSEYRAVSFVNLLGHDGFFLEVRYPELFYRRYYYAVEYGRLVCLADSFRPAGFAEERMDYMVDLDGDGDRELVCDVMYGGDGAARTEIYHFDGRRVVYGSGDSLLDAKDWYHWGTNSTAAEYLPDQKAVRIHYTREEDGAGYRDYVIDLEKMELWEYTGKY